MKLKIAYDNIIFSLQRAGGISVYWSELAKRFKNTENISFFEHANNNIFRNAISIKTDQECKLPIQILRYLPFLKSLPADTIFHSSYYRTTIQSNVIKIVTVYDFTYEYYRTGIPKLVHWFQKKRSIINADGIICISKSTENDLFKFFPKIDSKRVRTIHISAGEDFYKINDVNSQTIRNSTFECLRNKKIILYVGDRRSSYKNFNIAVSVVSKLEDFVLVSVGAGQITKKEQQFILKNGITARFYHFLGIDSSMLNYLFNISYCLLYPSSYEGFGIPILEAMRAGCPVVSTNFSSIPEVAGGAALLVDDISESSFIKEIGKLSDKRFRQQLIERGISRSKSFSWEKCYNETLEFYKDISNWKNEI